MSPFSEEEGVYRRRQTAEALYAEMYADESFVRYLSGKPLSKDEAWECRWAFQEAGLGRLISLIHPENKASEAVALRLGEKFRERISFEGKPANVFEIVHPLSAL